MIDKREVIKWGQRGLVTGVALAVLIWIIKIIILRLNTQ